MEVIIDPTDGGLESRHVVNVVEIELDLVGDLRIFHLALVLHIILHLLVEGEVADFVDIGADNSLSATMPNDLMLLVIMRTLPLKIDI